MRTVTNPVLLVRAAHGLVAAARPRALAPWYGARPPSGSRRPSRPQARRGTDTDFDTDSRDQAERRATVVAVALRALGLRQLVEVLLLTVLRRHGPRLRLVSQAVDLTHALSMVAVAAKWPWLRRPALTSAAAAAAYVTASRVCTNRHAGPPAASRLSRVDQHRGQPDPPTPPRPLPAPTDATSALRTSEPPTRRPLPGLPEDVLDEALPGASLPPPATRPQDTAQDAARVRPRLVWAGVVLAILGMFGIGTGMVAASPRTWITGSGVLALGLVVSLAGGILRDTRTAGPVAHELRAVARAEEQAGTSAPEKAHHPRAAQVAAGTREILTATQAGPAPTPRLPAAIVLMLFGAWLLVGQWVLVYPFDVSGQNTALRDTGFAVVVGLAGFRLCLAHSRLASAVAGVCGLLLVIASVFDAHAALRGTVNEAVTGGVVLLAAVATAWRERPPERSRRAASGVHRRQPT